MAAQVAVVSVLDDAHIPFVEKHLSAPMLRIDPQGIIAGVGLSFHFAGRRTKVTYNGQDVTNLKGIWLRKPNSLTAGELPVPDPYKEYSRSAVERLSAQLLTAFPRARWLSDYYAQNRANNKALQLRLAQECGFRVPPTVFTSSAAVARHFITQQGDCITKPLAVQFPRHNGKPLAHMTTRIGKDFMPKLDGLHLAPAIFQKAIDVDIEVRATVVGKQVFAATIADSAPTGKAPATRIRDSRHPSGTIQISSFVLPANIAKCCIAHCALLEIPFGAIDLIRDKRGTWWFLENNPNGQWAYIELATGQSIGKAIAEYLQG